MYTNISSELVVLICFFLLVILFFEFFFGGGGGENRLGSARAGCLVLGLCGGGEYAGSNSMDLECGNHFRIQQNFRPLCLVI